jgi:hypothetical protein
MAILAASIAGEAIGLFTLRTQSVQPCEKFSAMKDFASKFAVDFLHHVFSVLGHLDGDRSDDPVILATSRLDILILRSGAGDKGRGSATGGLPAYFR